MLQRLSRLHRRICEEKKVILKVVMMLRAGTCGMEKCYWGGGGGGGFLTENRRRTVGLKVSHRATKCLREL